MGRHPVLAQIQFDAIEGRYKQHRADWPIPRRCSGFAAAQP
jgi:hypothetical protein